MPFGLGRSRDAASPQPAPDDEYAPGWDALDAVFSAAYPGQDPHHWKPNDVPLRAQDGVWGISGYRDEASWFYVTYGLTDLFGILAKPEASEVGHDDVLWSGYGFELTMRVRSSDATPPMWPVELLSKLGKYVYQTRTGFEHGDRLDPRGPITGGNPPTVLRALAFAYDPVLEAVDTPLGRVEFITVVGITTDELARMKASTTDTVLTELRRLSPELATDPDRA